MTSGAAPGEDADADMPPDAAEMQKLMESMFKGLGGAMPGGATDSADM